ncbi:dTDP-glucose 4,6-dehydratase, partial [Xanthomonas vasicola]
KKELGWEPAYTFEQGIAQTVEWYLSHQDWVQSVLDGSYRMERIGLGA